MLFADVLQELIDGRQVVREAWPTSKGYLVLLPGMVHVWAITTEPTINAGNNLFSIEDYLAEDWCLLEERQAEDKQEEEGA